MGASPGCWAEVPGLCGSGPPRTVRFLGACTMGGDATPHPAPAALGKRRVRRHGGTACNHHGSASHLLRLQHLARINKHSRPRAPPRAPLIIRLTVHHPTRLRVAVQRHRIPNGFATLGEQPPTNHLRHAPSNPPPSPSQPSSRAKSGLQAAERQPRPVGCRRPICTAGRRCLSPAAVCRAPLAVRTAVDAALAPAGA